MKGEIIFKMSGSGNDFVFADGRALPLEHWTPERIREICARGTGVGADGFAVLEPGSQTGHVRFHFFNNNGSRAEMCGNGALCATRLAAWLELAPPEGMILATDSGPVSSRCLEGEGELAEIEVAVPEGFTVPDIPLGHGEQSMWLTVVGVPHLVVVVDDLREVQLAVRGRELRSHPAIGPAGANVNFIANGDAEWAMRTYERGVEAETLACGTGAVASATGLAREGLVTLPCSFRTATGFELKVEAKMTDRGEFESAKLIGQGRLVYRAVLGI